MGERGPCVGLVGGASPSVGLVGGRCLWAELWMGVVCGWGLWK